MPDAVKVILEGMLKDINFGKISLVVQNGKVIDVIKEERVRIQNN
jgi:hypothetical protein